MGIIGCVRVVHSGRSACHAISGRGIGQLGFRVEGCGVGSEPTVSPDSVDCRDPIREWGLGLIGCASRRVLGLEIPRRART